MRKYLVLGASALALGIGSSAARAEDPLKLTLSGGAQEAFGYVGNPDNKNNVGVNVGTHLGQIWEFGDGSIDFDAKTKLDNGVTVEFNAALNISGNADGGAARGSAAPTINAGPAQIGTSNGFALKGINTSENDWIAFSGSFGKIEIGDDFNSAFQVHNDAPYYGMVGGYNWGRNNGYIAGPGIGWANDQTVMFDDYEATKVVYTTPSFSGIGASVSYTPAAISGDVCCGAPNADEAVGGGDDFSAAAFYKGDMGDAKVNLDIGYVFENAGNTRGIDVGASVSIHGFTIGGSFLNRATTTSNASAALQSGDGVGDTWDIGVGFETGPWGLGIGYMRSSWAAAGLAGFAGAAVTGNNSWQEVPGSVRYNLGPGITLNAEIGWASWHTSDGQSQDQISGMWLLGGTTVSF